MSLEQRVRAALWGLYIFDALSMPVHWYYNVQQLQADFGLITSYHAPRAVHPGSIMAVSNTGGHGRGGQQGNIIGTVINHGKKQYWGKAGVHYHQGMQPGENTLNALCARNLVRAMTASRGYNAADALSAYVTFMTTPGTHNDTYAESFHRDFFSRFAQGVAPQDCAKGTEGHNTAQIGGLVMLPPAVLGTILQRSLAVGGDACDHAAIRAAAVEAAIVQLRLTHDSTKLEQSARVYAGLLSDLALGTPAKTAIEAACTALGRPDIPALAAAPVSSTDAIHNTFGSACYIESSLPAVLFLAYRYGVLGHPGSGSGSPFAEAAIANTNAGGENCHRGSALGALMGAIAGTGGVPAALRDGLHASAAIAGEIDAFVAAMHP
eukprot:m.231872 g.231872  ORF g.231872 m.231872 type:complete len:379 (-) comp12272_c0_seq1:46-1182(-)